MLYILILYKYYLKSKLFEKKIEIIAEAGVNHNGNLHLAKKLAKAAKDCGADYVKFQYFQPEFLATKNLKKAKYQINNYKTKNKSQKNAFKFES